MKKIYLIFLIFLFFVSVVSATVYNNDDSLVFYLDCEGDLISESGWGWSPTFTDNNATAYNSAMGKAGQNCEMDNTDYIYYSDTIIHDIFANTDYTICFWANSTASILEAWAYDDDSLSAAFVRILSANQVLLRHDNSETTEDSVSYFWSEDNSPVRHFCFTYEKATTNGTIYLNGVSVVSDATFANQIVADTGYFSINYIGAVPSTTQGITLYDEIVVLNRSASGEEILELYNNNGVPESVSFVSNSPISLSLINPEVNTTFNESLFFVYNVSDVDNDDIINCEYRSDVDGYIGNDSLVSLGIFNEIQINPNWFNQQYIYNITCYGNDSSVSSVLWDMYMNNSLSISWDNELPEDGGNYSLSPLVFHYNVSDPEMDLISNCTFYVNNSFSVFNSTVVNGENASFSYTGVDGLFDFWINCFDDKNLNVSSTVKTIYIDSVKPSYSWLFPYENGTYFNSPFVYRINVSDDNLYYTNVTVYNGSSIIYENFTEDYNVSSYILEDLIDLENVSNGSSDICVKVCDAHTLESVSLDYSLEGKTVFVGNSNFSFVGDVIDSVSVIKLSDRLSFALNLNSISPFMISLPESFRKVSSTHYKGHYVDPNTDQWFDTEPFSVLYDFRKDGRLYLSVMPTFSVISINSLGILNCVEGCISFLGDTGLPFVSQISPLSNSNLTISSNPELYSFSYNVSDLNGVSNCSFYLNGTYNQTDETIEKDISQSFSLYVSNESEYIWSVVCFDEFNNYFFSDNWTVNFTYIPQNSSNSSELLESGGGGGLPRGFSKLVSDLWLSIPVLVFISLLVVGVVGSKSCKVLYRRKKKRRSLK